MNLSIIIPTYNRRKVLRHNLLSLIDQKEVGNYEVIVCDDGSDDGTRDEVFDIKAKHNLPYTLNYKFQENKGFRAAAARNIGIRSAIGDIIMFLDQDIILKPNHLQYFLKVEENRILVGNKRLVTSDFYENEVTDDVVLKNFSKFHTLEWGTIRGTLSSIGSIQRNTLTKVGGFDEDFVGYGLEDTDLMERLYSIGIKWDTCVGTGFHIAHQLSHMSYKTQQTYHNKKRDTTRGPKIDIGARRTKPIIIVNENKKNENEKPKYKDSALTICLIYDNKFPYTVGFYSRRALMNLGHKVIYVHPKDLNKKKLPRVDFYLNIDDDSDYKLPEKYRPFIFWVSDTHRQPMPQWRYDKCLEADILFVAQKKAEIDLGHIRKNQGKDKSIFWLPHACDPNYHNYFHNSNQVEYLTKQYNVGFVGNVNSKIHTQREQYLNAVRKNIKNVNARSGLFLREMARLYAESKLVFNCSLNKDINMRLFEGMCSGTLVLTDHIPYLQLCFTQDNVFATYANEEELLHKIRYYLANQNEAEIIAKNAQKYVCENHTYTNRMEQLLNDIKGLI